MQYHKFSYLLSHFVFLNDLSFFLFCITLNVAIQYTEFYCRCSFPAVLRKEQTMLLKEKKESISPIIKKHPPKQSDYKKLYHNFQSYHHYTISQISHEIRNPLCLVSSSLQLIQTQHPEVLEYRYWNQIKDDLSYIARLLDDLTCYNNSCQLHLESVDMENLISSLVYSTEAIAHDRYCQITFLCPKALPLLTGDAVKLRQVLINLLKNAYDALDSPGGQIKISARCHNNMVEVNVADNGHGVPEDLRTTLFQPFITGKQNGTGLGLTITSNIIKAHGGKISYISNHNGSIFTFVLPVAQHTS